MDNLSSPTADFFGRRKSVRRSKQPVLYQTDPNIQPAVGSSSVKRKRPSPVPQDNEDVDDIVEEESSGDENEGEPDEEELKEQRRRLRAKKTSSKPAAKKPKTASNAPINLAMRPVASRAKNATKPRKPRAKTGVPQEDATGLYGMAIALIGARKS